MGTSTDCGALVQGARWRGHRSPRHVLTERGEALLSSLLDGERAVHAHVVIGRVFVKRRRVLPTREELARKLAALERTYDRRFRVVSDVSREPTCRPRLPPVLCHRPHRRNCYRLQMVCERRKRAQEAHCYDTLVRSLPAICFLTHESGTHRAEHTTMFEGGEA